MAAILAYHNSFADAFLLDDQIAIVENTAIRSFAGTGAEGHGALVRRPVVRWSLALNYALGGLQVGGYHALCTARGSPSWSTTPS